MWDDDEKSVTNESGILLHFPILKPVQWIRTIRLDSVQIMQNFFFPRESWQTMWRLEK